jgi:hypothetical protein
MNNTITTDDITELILDTLINSDAIDPTDDPFMQDIIDQALNDKKIKLSPYTHMNVTNPNYPIPHYERSKYIDFNSDNSELFYLVAKNFSAKGEITSYCFDDMSVLELITPCHSCTGYIPDIPGLEYTEEELSDIKIELSNTDLVHNIMMDMDHPKYGLNAYLESTGDPELYRPIVEEEIRVRTEMKDRSDKTL